MAEIRAYLAQALAFAQHTAQSARALLETEPAPVSYTHLDVYKRQVLR